MFGAKINKALTDKAQNIAEVLDDLENARDARNEVLQLPHGSWDRDERDLVSKIFSNFKRGFFTNWEAIVAVRRDPNTMQFKPPASYLELRQILLGQARTAAAMRTAGSTQQARVAQATVEYENDDPEHDNDAKVAALNVKGRPRSRTNSSTSKTTRDKKPPVKENEKDDKDSKDSSYTVNDKGKFVLKKSKMLFNSRAVSKFDDTQMEKKGCRYAKCENEPGGSRTKHSTYFCAARMRDAARDKANADDNDSSKKSSKVNSLTVVQRQDRDEAVWRRLLRTSTSPTDGLRRSSTPSLDDNAENEADVDGLCGDVDSCA